MPAKKTTANHNSLLTLLKAFPDEASCVSHLESLRWPTGIVCPLCGSTRKIYRVKRASNYKCADCRNMFSVRKGTIFEESRLPLQKWFAASWLVTNNRKGISSYQLAREIDVTQKTAWFMLSRLREVAGAMSDAGGSLDGTVEVDETYIGGKSKNMHASVRKEKIQGRGCVGKEAVLTIVERDGRVRSTHVSTVTQDNLLDVMRACITPQSHIMTDESPTYYGAVEQSFASHQTVNHKQGEYVRGEAYTNTAESFHSMLKRGVHGIYHHWSVKHLHRYLNEFDARWNMFGFDGGKRMDAMLESVPGLRLTYERLIK